jgi:hypothetical protein
MGDMLPTSTPPTQRSGRRPQYGLKTLFVATVLASVVVASLRSASDSWNSAVLTLMTSMLCIAVPVTILRRTDARPFWVGFVAIGWLYATLIFGPWLSQHVGAHLWPVGIVNKLADWVEPWWRDQDERVALAQMGGGIFGGRVPSRRPRPGEPFREGIFPGSMNESSLPTLREFGPSPRRANFYRIGHYWSVLLLAWIAGTISSWMCHHVAWLTLRRNRSKPAHSPLAT